MLVRILMFAWFKMRNRKGRVYTAKPLMVSYLQNHSKSQQSFVGIIFKNRLCSTFSYMVPNVMKKNYSVLLISDSYFKELPTLLHCAAKFGLKNLAVHLLQCSGATRASKIKNLEGSDPAHIAERHGHKELKKIFEDFSVSCFFSILSQKLFL